MDNWNKITPRGEDDIKFELIWTNSSPKTNFASQTIDLDLNNYEFIVVVTTTAGEIEGTIRSSSIFPVGIEQPFRIAASKCTASREIKISKNNIYFGNGGWGNFGTANSEAIPYKIYGVIGDIDIDI